MALSQEDMELYRELEHLYQNKNAYLNALGLPRNYSNERIQMNILAPRDLIKKIAINSLKKLAGENTEYNPEALKSVIDALDDSEFVGYHTQLKTIDQQKQALNELIGLIRKMENKKIDLYNEHGNTFGEYWFNISRRSIWYSSEIARAVHRLLLQKLRNVEATGGKRKTRVQRKHRSKKTRKNKHAKK